MRIDRDRGYLFAVGWTLTESQMFETGEAVARAFFDRWNDHDAEGIAALFAEDADFVNVVGLWWRNRRAIRKAHDYGLPPHLSGGEGRDHGAFAA